MQAYGISCTLPAGWNGRVFKSSGDFEDDFGPAAHASTAPLSAQDGDLADVTINTLRSTDVLVILSQYHVLGDGVIIAGDGAYESVGLPTSLSAADFDQDDALAGEGTLSTITAAQRFCTVSGRPFMVYVILGSLSGGLIAQANDVLSRFDIAGGCVLTGSYYTELPEDGSSGGRDGVGGGVSSGGYIHYNVFVYSDAVTGNHCYENWVEIGRC